MLSRLYENLVMERPLLTLLMVAIFSGWLGYHALDLEIDISADTLVLENDADLQYYRSISGRYQSDDYLIVTFTPPTDLFQRANLDTIASLRNDLATIERVSSVYSLLEAPLMQSPPISLSDLPEGLRSLAEPDIDLNLAEQELRTSPLFSDRLVGAEGETTALQVNFQRDETYLALRDRRDALRAQRLQSQLTPEEEAELAQVEAQFQAHDASLKEQEAADIAQIRTILDKYRDRGELHLGGVPMIVVDIMEYVRHDIRVYGLVVLLALLTLLAIIFQQLRWVGLPLLTALAASASTMGFLGLAGWPITIVSSNFISLLLIFVLSLTIHLIVRYRELQLVHPEADQRFLVRATVRDKWVPCFYTVATTMVAFISLVVSGIRPVIDFGWMMVIGLTMAFLMAFTLFPAILVLLKPGKNRRERDLTDAVTQFFSRLVNQRGGLIFIVCAISVAVGGIGMLRLTVENRFIDNFDPSTEIYQSMMMIDRELGGTTPLEVLIDAPPPVSETALGPETRETPPVETGGGFMGYVEDSLDFLFNDSGAEEAGITATSYWFNSNRAEQVAEIHKFLDQLPETGKVLSLASTMEVFRQMNGGEMPGDFTLSIIYDNLTPEIKRSLIDPYLSPDGSQARFSIRVRESDRSLQRNVLLEKIRDHLTGPLGLADEQVHLTGMLVLYNNMLQSLFRSQIMTLGAVLLAIFIMFVILFRSIPLAIVAIIPNLIIAPLVLGLMGGIDIPLDIMTITIAALSVGIGVDNSIHYVHRFGAEVAVDWDYHAAVGRSHQGIGRAMYYTTITITFGFSMLALSNFVPTIHFGLLTGGAMLIALTANFTLLPLMLEKLKPFRRPT